MLLKDPYKVRRSGLGILRVISDEAIIELLGYFGGKELANILKLSRALYVFCNYSDLWRDLTLRTFDGNVDFDCTWKDTFSRMTIAMLNENARENKLCFSPHKPIKVSNMFCNVLHRSWTCHTCDLQYACPGFYDKCEIPRRDATTLTTEEFVNEYESKNKPVIIKNATNEWKSMKLWNSIYLSNKCRKNKFRATSATAPLAANFSMKEYFQYSSQTKEEAALYLFDRDFTNIDDLGLDYEVPSYFNPKMASHGTDLFHAFGEAKRPDYRWLIAGDIMIYFFQFVFVILDIIFRILFIIIS